MRRAPFVALLALAACASDPSVRAPSSAAAAPAPRASIEEQAASAERASAPGPKHRALEPLEGTWSTVSADVDATGAETNPRAGRATLTWVLRGRFLRWTQELALETGTRVTEGYLGWDGFLDEYQLLMVSDLANGMGVAHGQGDPRRDGIRFVLDIPTPGSGNVMRATSILRADGPDHFVLEQIGVDASGREGVQRRTRFTRAAPITR